jgi:hypothetical protein
MKAPTIELTIEETSAIRKLINNCASSEGEDVIGLFMKHGLFRFFLEQDGLVNLAKKFDED